MNYKKHDRVYVVSCNDYGLICSEEQKIVTGDSIIYGYEVFLSDDDVWFHGRQDLQPAYPGMYIGQTTRLPSGTNVMLVGQIMLGRLIFRMTDGYPPKEFIVGDETYVYRCIVLDRQNEYVYDQKIKVDPTYRAEIERQCREMDETSRVNIPVQGTFDPNSFPS